MENDDDNDVYNPIPLKVVHEDMMQNDPAYREAYRRSAPKYALIEAMLDAREEADLTLEQIAQRMGTSKSALSRMLSGSQMPSWNTVMRYAEALGKHPTIQFVDAPKA